MVNFLLELAGWSVDAVSAAFVTALRWFLRVIALALGTFLLFLIASGLGFESVAIFLLWLLVAEVAAFALVFIPVLTLLRINQHFQRFTDATWRSWASLFLWVLTAGISLTLFVRWGEVKYAPLLALAFIVTALGYWVCDMRFSAKAAVYRNWLIVAVVLLLIVLPSLGLLFQHWITIINTRLRVRPELVQYRPGLDFFDSVDNGKPLYWYCECDSEYIFSGVIDRAFHPKTGIELKPLTYEKEQEFRRRWEQKREAERKARAEEVQQQKLAEEAKRQEEERQRKLAEAQWQPVEQEQPEREYRKQERSSAEERQRKVQTTNPKLTPIQLPLPPLLAEAKSADRQTVRPEVILAEGGQLIVRLEQTLSTDKSRAGDHFQASLCENLGYTDWGPSFPENTKVVGQISESVRAGKTKGRARISLLLTEIGNVQLETHPLIIEADPSIKKDAGKIARDVGAGLLIGLLGGGKKGVAIGGGIGAGAGVAEVLLTRGRAVKLPAETKLVFYLAKPLILTRHR